MFYTELGDCVVLVLLDLTATSDTVDNNNPLSRSELWVHIEDAVIEYCIFRHISRTFLLNLHTL